MNIKEKFVKAKDWTVEHCEAVGWTCASLLVGGFVVYTKGYLSGVKCGRSEWDFSNDKGKWAVIMEDDGEYRAALPMSALAEVMEKHRTIPWDDSKWVKR